MLFWLRWFLNIVWQCWWIGLLELANWPLLDQVFLLVVCLVLLLLCVSYPKWFHYQVQDKESGDEKLNIKGYRRWRTGGKGGEKKCWFTRYVPPGYPGVCTHGPCPRPAPGENLPLLLPLLPLHPPPVTPPLPSPLHPPLSHSHPHPLDILSNYVYYVVIVFL